VLARHIAETKFGIQHERRPMQAGDVIRYLLQEASRGPELWHQRAYLARVVVTDPDRGVYDDGIQPLAHFLDDADGPNAVAMTLEANGKDDPYPCAYLRQKGAPAKEILLDPDPLLNFETEDHRRALTAALGGVESQD
jgi:hypothetical protein